MCLIEYGLLDKLHQGSMQPGKSPQKIYFAQTNAKITIDFSDIAAVEEFKYF